MTFFVWRAHPLRHYARATWRIATAFASVPDACRERLHPRLAVSAAILAVCLAGLGSVAPEASESVRLGLVIGSPMPSSAARMRNIDGRQFVISDVRGAKGTLVIFTGNACPMARAWEPRIVDLGNHFSRRGVGVVVVNSNDPTVNAEDALSIMQARARDRGMNYLYAVDEQSELARAFGASRTPEVFLFSADGRLAYHGAVDDNAKNPHQVKEHYLRDALDAVVNGEHVRVPETKAFGCGIKFRPKT